MNPDDRDAVRGEMSRAPHRVRMPVPPLLAGQPPLAILVDYDGTISETDTSDAILYSILGDRFALDGADYMNGLVGSRTLMSRQIALLPGDEATLADLVDAQRQDPTFAGFVERALELDVPVEVVSDGFGYYIEAALRRLDVPSIPVITAHTTFDGSRAAIAFPNGHPDCLVCGTCKRQRVTAHQATGRSVIFIGDGETDRYAAACADLVFAKRDLIRLCVSEGWDFTPWNDFSEVTERLEVIVAGWRSDPVSLPRKSARPFICGPEAWGPGRLNPPRPGEAGPR
jgi:2-hydroxy-3-keto-5-methylthiopentenyl-1-phosphate phosphatase